MNTRFRSSAGSAGYKSALHQSAFTMIEIAISLAIIGFALVAIIGVLPLGMNVQKDNRHETIINQDFTVFINAIRNGERGLDDLTNYILGITNYTVQWQTNANGSLSMVNNTDLAYGYTRLVSTTQRGYMGTPQTPAPNDPPFPLISGARIIGLLTTPKIVEIPGGFISNHVVAVVRSLSGPASEKVPQDDPVAQSFALNYRMIAEVLGVGTNNWYDPSWTNYNIPGLPLPEVYARSNFMRSVLTYQQNLHDVRLTFRWPVAVNGKVGDNRQVFRTMVGGQLIRTNEPTFTAIHCTLYYLNPPTYLTLKGT